MILKDNVFPFPNFRNSSHLCSSTTKGEMSGNHHQSCQWGSSSRLPNQTGTNSNPQGCIERESRSFKGKSVVKDCFSETFLHRLIDKCQCLTGFKLAKKFREKFCLPPRKFGRSFYLNFRFAYIFYTSSLLPQLKIGRSLFI